MKTLSLVLALVLTGCGGGGASDETRLTDYHQELKIVDPTVSGSSVSASAISIGSVYLETAVAPLALSGAPMQASEVMMKNADAYVAYSTKDTATTVIKRGAIEHLKAYDCDNLLTLGRVEWCLSVKKSLEIPTADIFSSFSDGSNLFAVGSTLDESQSPSYGRLFKIPLDVNADPTAVTQTVALPSYAGNSVTVVGSKVLTTSGTSVDASKMGGLSIFNLADLSLVKYQPLYDARSVSAYANSPSSVYVATGKLDGTTGGRVVQYNTDGTGVATRTIVTGGNTIAESKSSVQVGNQLLLASGGDQGFKVLCKSTGATLASIGPVTVSGIAATNTVTNAVVAAPGYIFAANGEAGVYVYAFKKTNVLTSDLCAGGVTVTLLGRLALTDGTYVPGLMSANSIFYVPTFNLLNILTSKLIMIASGNGGMSLLNISGLTLLSTDVDDF